MTLSHFRVHFFNRKELPPHVKVKFDKLMEINGPFFSCWYYGSDERLVFDRDWEKDKIVEWSFMGCSNRERRNMKLELRRQQEKFEKRKK